MINVGSILYGDGEGFYELEPDTGSILRNWNLTALNGGLFSSYQSAFSNIAVDSQGFLYWGVARDANSKTYEIHKFNSQGQSYGIFATNPDQTLYAERGWLAFDDQDRLYVFGGVPAQSNGTFPSCIPPTAHINRHNADGSFDTQVTWKVPLPRQAVTGAQADASYRSVWEANIYSDLACRFRRSDGCWGATVGWQNNEYTCYMGMHDSVFSVQFSDQGGDQGLASILVPVGAQHWINPNTHGFVIGAKYFWYIWHYYKGVSTDKSTGVPYVVHNVAEEWSIYTGDALPDRNFDEYEYWYAPDVINLYTNAQEGIGGLPTDYSEHTDGFAVPVRFSTYIGEGEYSAWNLEPAEIFAFIRTLVNGTASEAMALLGSVIWTKVPSALGNSPYVVYNGFTLAVTYQGLLRLNPDTSIQESKYAGF